MATLKKKNPETGEWEVWASGSASGIYSVNSSLFTEEDQQYITVDDALVRDRADIEEMKRNIAWLALHGGGGSGWGSGSEAENSIEFIYKSESVTSITWTASSRVVEYRLLSSKNSTRFSVIITLDGTQIWSGENIAPSATSTKSVTIANIKAYSNSSIHRLRITATDVSGNVVYNECIISELSVSLRGNSSVTVNRNELDTANLTLTYQTTEIGLYNLYYSRDKGLENDISLNEGFVEINVGGTGNFSYTIGYKDNLFPNIDLVTVGQTYNFYFILVNTTDPVIRSEQFNCSVTITSPTDIAVSRISLNTNIDDPTVVSKNSILYADFIAYLSGNNVAYMYNVAAQHLVEQEDGSLIASGDIWTIKSDQRGEYGKITTVLYNEFPSVAWFVAGERYKIITTVTDINNPSKVGTLNTYILVSAGTGDTLPVNAEPHTIFDFYIYGAAPTINSWRSSNSEFIVNNKVTTNTQLELHSMGGKSDFYNAYCRLTNKAYGIVKQTTIDGVAQNWFPTENSNGLILSQRPQFTLSISYYNDYTPDDDRTVMSLGNFIPSTESESGIASGYGILIKNHDYYVKLGESSQLITGKIQDSIYHQFDFVFGEIAATTSAGLSSVFVKIYHNGVLLRSVSGISDKSIYTWRSFNEIYIACKNDNGILKQFTNINLQSIALYNTCLNPYQIVCKYINNIARYQLTGENSNELNTELINEKMATNLITYNPDTKEFNCALWDIAAGDYNDKLWINIENNSISLANNLATAAKIPIIVLDFSARSAWTWGAFTGNYNPSNILAPATSVPIYYFTDGVNRLPTGTTCDVSIQGTTTLGYAIKNLNIDFGTSRLFWPKKDWFPEQVFTLKADIVDSAHANNACVGAFVNRCADVGILEPTPPMAYFSEHRREYAIPETCDANIKHTLEGFPVLVIARFFSTESNVIKSLGIYSFNLGRESYFNMGFRVLNKFRDTNGQVLGNSVSAPALLGAPIDAEDVIDMQAESWEGRDSINCSPKSKEEGNFSSEAASPVQLDGYFWSSLPGHINYFWENKYPGNASITEFQAFMKEMVNMPYTKGTFTLDVGSSVYEYDYNSANGLYIPEGSQPVPIERRSRTDETALRFNATNARFYYIVCMLAGLVDNLGKNLNMRMWKNGSGSYVGKWFTCFYDMDTAFGEDNTGDESIEPDAFDERLRNSGDSLVMEFISGNSDRKRVYTVKDAKIWGVVDQRTFKDQYSSFSGGGGADNSTYAIMWNSIREALLNTSNSFMDKYFGEQVAGLGELVYNQDFDVKYVSTAQTEFMHGDRKAFVRDWLNKRVKFLDSVFGYKQRSGDISYLTNTNIIKDASYNKRVTITHNSGSERLPFISNVPIILNSSIGGTGYYFYLPANTPTFVKVANPGGSNNIQTVINNSDCILTIQNLNELRVNSITPTIISGDGNHLETDQYGSFSSFSELNLSGNTTFRNNGIDFITTFKTWNEGVDTKPYSLTSIDLTNTKSNSVTSFPLTLTAVSDLIYSNPFENLTDIDLTNSCVTSLSLPENVSLFTLNIANSAIQSANLSGQTVLDNVDFTQCIALQELRLNNCSAYKKLTLDKLPVLSNISVLQCESLEEISIDAAESYNNLTINVSDTPALKKFTLTNSFASDSSIALAGAVNLEELILNDCRFETVSLPAACKSKLKSISFNNSTVKAILWIGDSGIENEGTNILDLRGCNNLITLDLINNSNVEYIQFNNIQDSPVIVSTPFTSCVNLKRVYGNIKINCSSCFSGCTNFSILGSDLNSVTFNGVAAKNNVGLIKHFTDDETSSEAIHFEPYISGDNVTNLTFATTTADSTFRQTKCTGFDVYYILWNIGSATNLQNMFHSCSNIGLTCSSTVDNSPHWTMFNKCGNATSINHMFYSNTFRFRIYSKCDDHQSLFSPLVSCEDYGYAFFGMTYITDRNVFKRSVDGNLPATNIDYFNPIALVNDVNTLTASQCASILGTPDSTRATNGNLLGFFNNIPNLSGQMYSVFYSTNKIDYSTFNAIPSGVTIVRSCFRSTYGEGNMVIKDLFKNRSVITAIYQSFRVTTSGTTNVTLDIDNDTLEGFTNLVNLGYTTSSTYPGSKLESSFRGNGLIKRIVSKGFPYDIIKNSGATNKLRQFVGFFENASFVDSPGTVNLPGDLFKNCTALQDISYCFSNFGNSYTLDSDKFIGTKLTDVDYCFSHNNSVLSGGIPKRLFNLGFVSTTVFYTGTTQTAKPITVSYDESSTNGNTVTLYRATGTKTVTNDNDEQVTVIIRSVDTYTQSSLSGNSLYCTPLSTVTHVTQETDPNSVLTRWITRTSDAPVYAAGGWSISDVSFTYNLPIATISSMNGCFYGINADPYSETNPTVENNGEYCPFEYILSDGMWTKVNRNDYNKTYIWEFDGVHYAEDNANSGIVSQDNILSLDAFTKEEANAVNGISASWQVLYDSSATPVLNFCAPPDLLRWCTSGVNVTNLFSNAGHTRNDGLAYSSHSSLARYGLKGRICPYMFKSVPNITDITDIFAYCTHLYGFKRGTNSTWLIPEQLFTYTPNLITLKGAFRGCSFEKDPPLSTIFISLKNSINVQEIFGHCWFGGGTSSSRSTVANVFNQNNVSNPSGAFNQSNMQPTINVPNCITAQYVAFNNVFGKSTNSNQTYVFDGYDRNYVQHETNKTVDESEYRYNYRTR